MSTVKALLAGAIFLASAAVAAPIESRDVQTCHTQIYEITPGGYRTVLYNPNFLSALTPWDKVNDYQSLLQADWPATSGDWHNL